MENHTTKEADKVVTRVDDLDKDLNKEIDGVENQIKDLDNKIDDNFDQYQENHDALMKELNTANDKLNDLDEQA